VRSQNGARPEVDDSSRFVSDNSGLTHTPLECVDRDNTHSMEIWDEPGIKPGPGRGENGASKRRFLWNSALNIDAVIQRHDERKRWAKDDTLEQYRQTWADFAQTNHLDEVNRRQLKTRGRRLLRDYILRKPEGSRRFLTCHLKSYWECGLDLDWPINNKRDLGRFVPIGKRISPNDSMVKPWAEAIEHEPDIYTKSALLGIMQYGWRPSHIQNLKWRNVLDDESGDPYAIVADGAKEGFKTSAWIVAILYPDARRALKAWREQCPQIRPEGYIWPYRDAKGYIDNNRKLTEHGLHVLRRQFCERWHLKSGLTPNSFRHWVSYKLDRAGIEDKLEGALCGHEIRGAVFTSQYDCREVRTLLDEEDADLKARLPYGPLGIFRRVDMEMAGEVPKEWVQLWMDLKSKKVFVSDSGAKIEAILNEALVEEVRDIEP